MAGEEAHSYRVKGIILAEVGIFGQVTVQRFDCDGKIAGPGNLAMEGGCQRNSSQQGQYPWFSQPIFGVTRRKTQFPLIAWY